MYFQTLALCTILLPVVSGALVLILPSAKNDGSDKEYTLASITELAVTLILNALLLIGYMKDSPYAFVLLSFTEELEICFSLDALGGFFLAFISAIWLLGGIFSIEYLKHEKNIKRFWGFYLLTLGALNGLCLSSNIFTLYFFFEMMTLVSMPLVLHSQSHESVMASLKYLFYSMCGAYMALFGVFVLSHMTDNMSFVAGGVFSSADVSSNPFLFQLAVMMMVLGFGVKAGMLPMHAWLPTAHPVAPAPASAVLSAVIVKGGVLAILRSVFYTAGAQHIRGTWVQQTWMVLAMMTVFMGSMLAYNEKLIKKRLAYSSVSQASYIMLGMSVLDPTAMTGSLLHVLYHALSKTVLFLVAGAIIYKTGRTRVDELKGIGKEMPITMWCFIFAALSLIGIPPTGGFVSKWYLAEGLLGSDLGLVGYIGVIVLLVSAILTAGYLLPIAISGFLPGSDYDYASLKSQEPSWRMTVPLVVLAVAVLITGIMPGGIISWLQNISGAIS